MFLFSLYLANLQQAFNIANNKKVHKINRIILYKTLDHNLHLIMVLEVKNSIYHQILQQVFKQI